MVFSDDRPRRPPRRLPVADDAIDGRRFLRLRGYIHRIGESLFVVPALFVVVAIGLAQAVLSIDRTVESGALPTFFDTTVESSRSLLSAIAGGTITGASVVFSLTLIAVQLSTSQYSPRSLGNFLGDRFQQLVIGVVLGTFTFSLVVLREVRGPLDEGGDAFVPRVSVSAATVLAIVALMMLIASINHTAQSLRVESVLDRVTNHTVSVIRERYGNVVGVPGPHVPTDADHDLPHDAVFLGAPRAGWVQQLSPKTMLAAVPEGSTVHLAVVVGDNVIDGAPLAYVSPPPADIESAREHLLEGIVIGSRRTLQQDVAFGITQLNDVALRALSPGINDPNTAIEVIGRLGTIIFEILRCGSPSRVVDHESRRLVRATEPDHSRYFDEAFDPIRRNAADQPEVLLALATTVHQVHDTLRANGHTLEREPFDRHLDAIREVTVRLDGRRDRERLLAVLDRDR